VRWTGEQLVKMVDNRLAEVYRGEYMQAAPTLADILPQKRKRPGEEEPLDYVLERTLMRPRDLIDLLNRCFDETCAVSRLTLADLRSAEVGYSEARLNAIVDEWDKCYFGLRATFPLLTKLGPRFGPEDIREDDVIELLADDRALDCPWLRALAEQFSGDAVAQNAIRGNLIETWYLVGLIGMKDSHSHRTHFSLDRAINLKTDIRPDSTFVVLKMLRSALGRAEKSN
jgi:hypothetical protein